MPPPQVFPSEAELTKWRSMYHHVPVFPSEAEFTKWCSCDECYDKITQLKIYQNEIQCKWLLVMESRRTFDLPLEQCWSLSIGLNVMEDLLSIIEKKLRSVKEFQKLGLPTPENFAALAVKFKNSALGIRNLCKNLLGDEYLETDPIGESEDESKEVISLIYESHEADIGKLVVEVLECVMYQYNKFGGDEGTLGLIRKMETELAGKLLDPSTLKKLIEDVIKLVEALPVDQLYERLVGLRKKAILRNYYLYKFKHAESLIDSVILDLGKFEVNGNGNHHSLNGFNQTLDSLLDTVNTFNKCWMDEYDPIFEEFHRPIPLRDPSCGPDPKRQRIE